MTDNGNIIKGAFRAAVLLAVLTLVALPAPSFAVTQQEFAQRMERSLGRKIPDRQLSNFAGQLTRRAALKLSLEALGWGFTLKSVEALAAMPEWQGADALTFLVSTMKPGAPASIYNEPEQPLTAEDMEALARWLYYCRLNVSWMGSFPWHGTELILVKHGEGSAGGSPAGNGSGRNEPFYAAMLAADMKKTPTHIMKPQNAGQRKQRLASLAAAEQGAVGGVNGGYFGGSLASPVGVLRRLGRHENVVFYPNRSALGWSEAGEYEFIDGKESGNISAIRKYDKYTEVLQAGPLLLKNGKKAVNKENIKAGVLSGRDPRTFAATDGARIFWGVVDGRDSAHSTGVTMKELRTFCSRMGFKEALNLDGGGSSSLWWRGVTFTKPSDKKERPIPYAVLLYEPEAQQPATK